MENEDLKKKDDLAVAAIRCLLIDEIAKANSGHPGMALDIAPAMYALFKYHLVSDPKNPNWINRDRFVLSSGHNSELLYAVLHVCGYDISMEDLKEFRQLGSLTPGHPEYGLTPGVDATAGPLGQGVSQAVGMAMAEEKIRHSYPEGESLIDHYTYCLCGDGCLEEGIAQEAISLAGKQKLNKLILIYDENTSTLDGPTTNSMTEDEVLRFKAEQWNVIEVMDGNSVEGIKSAIAKAKESTDMPTMILVHTIIGYGTMNEGSCRTHGSPLSAEDIVKTKKFYGYDYPEFTVPSEIYEDLKEVFAKRGEEARLKHVKALEEYGKKHSKEYEDFKKAFARDISSYGVDDPAIKGNEATRNASGKYLANLASKVPFTFGGSADVAGSVKTMIPGDPGFDREHRDAKNINFGIREFAMAGAQNGMLLHGGLITYVGCFLVFSDYMKSAIRMSCLEKIPAIYLFSHDTIAVGEDGPTHEPIEQMAALRTMPDLDMIRPCDEKETYAAWRLALESHDHPTALVLTRQNLLAQKDSSYEGVKDGAYVISKSPKSAAWEIIASGSEVSLAVSVQQELAKKGIYVDVISMPSTYRFDLLSPKKKESILSLPRNKRIAIEMASGATWYKYADHVLSLDEFGRSGPAEKVLEYFGFTVEAMTKKVEAIIKS